LTPRTGRGWKNASPWDFWDKGLEWQKQLFLTFYLGAHQKVLLEKVFNGVGYEQIKLKDGIDMKI
jgi:hypothetical protein